MGCCRVPSGIHHAAEKGRGVLIVLCGSDRLGVRERRAALLAAHVPPGAEEFGLTRLDGQKCTPDDLVQAVQALPFLTDTRTVVVDDLLSRFEARRGKSRRGQPAADEPGDDGDDSGEAAPAPRTRGGRSDPAVAFADALAHVPETTTLLCWERGPLAKTNPLLKVAAKTGKVEVFDAPRAAEIDDWIFARARAKGLRLRPDVPRLLAEFLGADLEVLDAELEKLALYAGPEGRVDADTVRLLTAQTQQADTLQLLNAASDHHPAEALSLLHALIANGVAPVAIIGMLGSQVRKLLQVQALAGHRLPPAEIAHRLSMHPYAARMAVESLRHHTATGLHDLHRRLVETDQAIKTGLTDGEAALELLVLDLARR